MDLQEICRDQSEVAAAKKQAVQIVNRRLQVRVVKAKWSKTVWGFRSLMRATKRMLPLKPMWCLQSDEVQRNV